MKPEEAIEILKQNKEIMEMISPPDKQTESLMLAIEALEKQTDMKVTKVIGYSRCPSCKRFNKEDYGYAYCKVCGQKLDWSEE